MSWVHCNSCFTRYKSSIKFNLTSCGHVLCDKCLMANSNDCPICNSKFESKAISSGLDPQLESFFRPVQNFFDKVTQITNFQLSNITSLLNHITQKYNYAKAEIVKAYNIIKKLKKENEQLKLQLSRLSFTSNRSGDSNSTKRAPSNFSLGDSKNSMIFKKLHRPNGPPPLWTQHGLGRSFGARAQSSSFEETHDVSGVSGPSSSHLASYKGVGPSPIMPISHLTLYSGNKHRGGRIPEQKYKR